MKDGRDCRGRFAAGNPGGPGRPRRATEEEYLRALSRIVSLEDLRAIARRAVADAKKGNARARDWVSKYLLGEPAPQPTTSPDGPRRAAQALPQVIRDEMCHEQEGTGPAGEGVLPIRPDTPQALRGVATPLPSEGQR